MTLVKCWSMDTGQVETLATFERPSDEDGPEAFLATLIEQDQGSHHVYYLAQEG